MNNKIVFVLLGSILLGGFFLLSKAKFLQSNQTVTIFMRPGKFEPQFIIVQKGTKVIFKNEDTRGRWPASNTHPTHKRYPGSGIEKCGTAQEKNIFDACGVAPRKDYSFVFNEVGDWKYHDHLMPSVSGETKVIE